MASRNVRWACPAGKHPGVLGPSKPRRENLVRYCVPCSVEAGKLVERVAPALERKRADRAAKLEEKRNAKVLRERERAVAARSIAGVDLEKETRRLMRLKEFKALRRMPEIQVRRYRLKPGTLGRGYPWEHRILINDYPGITEEDVRETLVHELVHLIVGSEPGHAHWHGRTFRRTMADCFEAAYGVTAKGPYENRYHGRYAAALRARSER